MKVRELRMIAVVLSDLVDHHVSPGDEPDDNDHARDGEKFDVAMHVISEAEV